MRRLQLYGFTALLLVTVCAHAAAAEPPLWARALAEDGYHAPATQFDSSLALSGGYGGIAFLSEDVLAVWYLSHGSVALRSRKDSADSAITLHAVFIRVSDGKALSEQHWPGSIDARLLATHDGEFIVYTAGHLTRYSANFKPLAEADLHVGAGDYLPASVSPDGRFLAMLLETSKGINVIRLDSDTLHLLDNFVNVKVRSVSLTDSAMYITSTPNVGPDRSLIGRRAWGGQWEKLFGDRQRCLAPDIATASEQLIAAQMCAEIVFLDSTGKRLGATTGETRSYLSRSAVSADTNAFGFLALEISASSTMLQPRPERLRVTIFRRSGSKATKVLSLSLPPVQSTFNFALSPSGSKVAVLRDGNVELRQVPDH